MVETVRPSKKNQSFQEVKPPQGFATGKESRAFVIGGNMSPEDAQMLSDALAAGPNDVVKKRESAPISKPEI